MTPLPTLHPTAAAEPGRSADTQVKLARAAAELLGCPIAALDLVPGQRTITWPRRPENGGGRFVGSAELWRAMTTHLWFARRAVAIPELEGAPALLGAMRSPVGIRSCLAAPLVGSAGRYLGSLCVASDRPRDWTADEIVTLEELARRTSAEIEAALSATAASTGASGRRATGRPGPFLDPVETPLRAEPAPDGSAEALAHASRALLDARGEIDQGRALNRALIEGVPFPYVVTNGDGVIEEANDAAAVLFSSRRTFLVGKPLAGFLAEGARPTFRARLRQLRAGGKTEWPVPVLPRGGNSKMMVCAASATASAGGSADRAYWLFRDARDGEGADAPPRDAEAGVGRESGTPSGVDFEELIAHATPRAEVPVVRQLHQLIASALDTGDLQVGQRLPSIRTIADRFGVTSYAALQAYATLEAEGVVERRERSGVYVASVDWPAVPRLPETAEWLASVLTQACDHQLRIPQLPDLVRRWTGSATVRAVCVESCGDSTVALTHELSSRFGVEAVGMRMDELLAPDGGARRTSTLPAALLEAHLLVTTTFHASRVRPIAEATGKPLLVATINPAIVEAIQTQASRRDLTVVCVDPRYGERLRDLQGGRYRNRIRVLLAGEVEAMGLDRVDPVFLTLAARQRLSGVRVRLVAPPSPAFSLDFARKMAATLIRLNLDAGG